MTSIDMSYMLAERLSNDIIRDVDAAKQGKLQIRPCYSNQCSDIGHDCERYLTYRRTRWQEQTLPPVDLQYIFDEGHQQEIQIRRTLEDAGYIITQDGQSFTWKEFNITGTIDGKIAGDRSGMFPTPIPYDAKSMSPHVFQSIKSVDDFRKYPWTRKYVAQLVMYMILTGADAGLFVLKNKSTGRLKIIPLPLDFQLGEEMIQRAERVNAHVKAGTLPDPIEYKEDVCGKCSFFHICNPNVEFKGAHFESDEEALMKVTRLFELEETAKEYETLKKEITEAYKSRFQDTQNGEKFILSGEYAITGKWVVKNIPQKPATPATQQAYWLTKIMPVQKLSI